MKHVLIAHQSPLERRLLCNRLESHFDIQVERAVTDLSQAYDFAEHFNPACVVLSYELANCPEFELLNALLHVLKIGCVIVDSPQEKDCTLPLLRASKHLVRIGHDAEPNDLLDAVCQSNTGSKRKLTCSKTSNQRKNYDEKRLILLGASTGGVDALLNILKIFTPDCPPAFIVQHTGGQFSRSLIRLLDGGTTAKVCCATDGSPINCGHIYLAPDDTCHLQLGKGKSPNIRLAKTDSVSGHRPSIDQLFYSAIHLAPFVTAALLTGMGRDGAAGITALRHAGATTIGQDKATSVVYGMPRIAAELGGIMRQLPIDQIGPALLQSSQTRSHV